jgi:molecular chaperone GrpE
MNPEQIETLLADFRAWLSESPPEAAPQPAVEGIDIATIVGHFTALRHEVNLLTKTTRVAVEQNAEALKELRAPTPADLDARAMPLVKALVDVADSLTVAMKQVERSREGLDEILDDLAEIDTETEAPLPANPGFFARLFGVTSQDRNTAKLLAAEHLRREALQEVLNKLLPLSSGLSDGYAMSLRRVEKVLPQFGLEPMTVLGEPFDPELMEVVEVVAGPTPGVVVEEVRRGYFRAGAVFRFALVKVAR